MGFKNITPKKVWQGTRESSTQNLSRKPLDSGARSILSHFCNGNFGLLSDCLLLFQGSKSSNNSDYHSEMSWDLISNWYEKKLFPALKTTGEKAVLV